MATYFNKALNLTNASLLKTMRTAIGDHSYDTIVGTGLSGTIFTARVAPTLKKKFAIVRKPDDLSTHSSIRVEGQVGEKWIFVDDFVSGGGTFMRVLEMMKEHHPNCEFTGIYQYERGLFLDPYQASREYGKWVLELSIGVPFGPPTRAQFIAEKPYDRVDLRRPIDGWGPQVRQILPLAPLSRLEVDYPDSHGAPTIWDADNGIRRKAGDSAEVRELVNRVIEASKTRGVPLRRMVGLRLDMLPKTPTMDAKPWIARGVVDGDPKIFLDTAW